MAEMSISSSQSGIYKIFCVMWGEYSSFPITIANTETVGDLKKRVKEEKKNELDHIDADKLTLYQVDILDDDDADTEENVKKRLSEPLPKVLKANKELSKLYDATPPKKRIHILVKVPSSQGLKRKRGISSQELLLKRFKAIESLARLVPSTAAERLHLQQFSKEEKIQYNRSPNPKTIPIVLLWEGFGQFAEDLATSPLTAEDHLFAARFRSTMVKFYTNEQSRNDAFHMVWREAYDRLDDFSYAIGNNCTSDGHIVEGDYVILITELKNELGEGGPQDAAAQAALYHNAALSARRDLKEKLELYPCLIVYIIGPYIGFAGTVVTEAHTMELLTPMYPVHTNYHETEIALQLTRAFKALKRTLAGLHKYYRDLPKSSPTSSRDMYPYPRSYETPEGKSVEFTYTRRISPSKLVFKGKTSEGDNICVKFTRRYSKDAHQHCADHEVAPKLHALKKLPGGWIIVIMEWLGDGCELVEVDSSMEVRVAAKKAVEILHEGGFVHGDMRAVNMMAFKTRVGSDEQITVKLLDFDWAGLEGEVKYPPHLNREGITWPEGVVDEAPILKEHDLDMINKL